MDFFLIIIIIFMAFSVLRGYLRGTIMCVMDLLALGLSTIIALSSFSSLGYALYTTEIYTNARMSISGMMNFNSIMNSYSNSEPVGDGVFSLPKIISDFVEKNNTPQVYKSIGVTKYDDYIIDVFANIIVITIAFLIIFTISYFVLYLIKVSIMPKITVVEFGTSDKIISIVLGFIKGLLIIFIVLALVPILFTKFNWAVIYENIYNSPTLNHLYNVNPILKKLLDGVYIF